MMAPNRTRFNYNPTTRERFFKELDAIDEYVGGVELTRLWAVGINQNKGVFKYIKSVLG